MASACVAGWRTHATTLPEQVGNAPANLQRARRRADPNAFAFFVVGDRQKGHRTFGRILDEAARGDPAFLAVVGDIAESPEWAYHRLFARQMASADPPFPVLLVPGNHDIHPREPFDLDAFERFYGPSQFSLRIGRWVMVFLNNADTYLARSGYVAFLRRVLADEVGEDDRVMVFLHTPPAGVDIPDRTKVVPAPAFMDLAADPRVRCVFMGHHHAYHRQEIDGTTFIVAGGGGATLRGPTGHFHHVVRVDVSGDDFEDRVIRIEPGGKMLAKLDRLLVARLFATMTDGRVNVAVSVAVAGLLCGLLVWSIRRSARSGGLAARAQHAPARRGSETALAPATPADEA